MSAPLCVYFAPSVFLCAAPSFCPCHLRGLPAWVLGAGDWGRLCRKVHLIVCVCSVYVYSCLCVFVCVCSGMADLPSFQGSLARNARGRDNCAGRDAEHRAGGARGQAEKHHTRN